MRFLKLFWISLSAKYTGSVCLPPARFLCQSAGDCTWSIALELHAILVETLLIGLFISWGVQPFSSVKIHRIQRIHWVHITVYILFDNIGLHVISNLCSMSRKYLIFPEKFPRFPDSRQNLQIPGINLFFSRNSLC